MTPVPFVLKSLFSSRLRVRVLSHFFFHPGEAFHVRGLAKELRESVGNVARELARLAESGILTSQPMGNQKRFMPREDNPILEDLRNLFLKTSGASIALKETLERINGAELAFLYGSYARGEAHAASDLDLMVIGDISEKKLAPAVARVERRLKRPINYVACTRGEVEKRLGTAGDFVHEVFTGPKIVLIGNTDDRLFGTC